MVGKVDVGKVGKEVDEVRKEAVKKELRTLITVDNATITKDFVLENNITSEDIYNAILELLKENRRMFQPNFGIDFDVEEVAFYNEKEKEWEALVCSDPIDSETFELDDFEEDIVDMLEKRKQEFIIALDRLLDSLKDTEDEEDGELVCWGLSIHIY